MATFISCSKDEEEKINENLVIGSVTDIDGNVYPTVTIGDQNWMAQNLKVTHYADGTSIPLVEDNNSWAILGENNSDKGYCFYNNEESEEYGALYTYAAAVNGEPFILENSQGVCPEGWHLPNNEEWIELINYVGGIDDAGRILKETGAAHWLKSSETGDNAYYFNALPGGNRYLYDGTFERLGSVGYWWSSTQNTALDAYAFSLHYSSEGIYYTLYGKSYGMSVRCIED